MNLYKISQLMYNWTKQQNITTKLKIVQKIEKTSSVSKQKKTIFKLKTSTKDNILSHLKI